MVGGRIFVVSLMVLARFSTKVWHNGQVAELPKVVVEGKGGGDG
jgi:hypothetical protein